MTKVTVFFAGLFLLTQVSLAQTPVEYFGSKDETCLELPLTEVTVNVSEVREQSLIFSPTDVELYCIVVTGSDKDPVFYSVSGSRCPSVQEALKKSPVLTFKVAADHICNVQEDFGK